VTLVLDASITMAWCFEDETSPVAEAVLELLQREEAVVPSLWRSEVADVLLVAERRGRITEAQATRLAALLARMPIRATDEEPDLITVLSVGRQHGLSAYDASYLCLAAMAGARLATLDTSLAAAARSAGVELIDQS
jgi:predicted nucleic acid-binding protein